MVVLVPYVPIQLSEVVFRLEMRPLLAASVAFIQEPLMLRYQVPATPAKSLKKTDCMYAADNVTVFPTTAFWSVGSVALPEITPMLPHIHASPDESFSLEDVFTLYAAALEAAAVARTAAELAKLASSAAAAAAELETVANEAAAT
jgi:hypothetical protein